MRVCLSSPYAYPLFDPADRSPIGGAERRAHLLAQGLAREGAEVHVLVDAPLRFSVHAFDGMQVWNTGDGYRAMRSRVSEFWSPGPGRRRRWNWRLLWELPLLVAVKALRVVRDRPVLPQFLAKQAPDVVGVFGVSDRSAEVLRAASRLPALRVLFLAANCDLRTGSASGLAIQAPVGDSGIDCRPLLATADIVMTQTPEQQELLRDRFGREGTPLTAPFDFAAWDALRSAAAPKYAHLDRYFLWVGRADRFHKRPLLALQLATKLPEVKILMVVNPGDPEVLTELRRCAPSNVQIVEQAMPDEMPALLSRSRGLVSTSSLDYEGAPNVFREAAASGVPVLSLEVPGDLLDQVDAGRQFQGDLDAMTQVVQTLWHDDELFRRWGENGRRHVQSQHDVQLVARQLLNTLQAALDRKRMFDGAAQT